MEKTRKIYLLTGWQGMKFAGPKAVLGAYDDENNAYAAGNKTQRAYDVSAIDFHETVKPAAVLAKDVAEIDAKAVADSVLIPAEIDAKESVEKATE